MKKSTLLLLISTALFFTSTLVLLYLNYLKPTSTSIPSTGIIPTEEQTPTASITSKNYINNIHHLSFSYPATWTLSNQNDQEKFNTDLTLTMGNAKIHFIFNLDGIGGQTQNYQGKAFNLDGHNVYLYTSNDYYGNDVITGITDSLSDSLGVLLINKTSYLMTLRYPKEDPLAEKYQQDFNQILSTFKFTDIGSSLSSNETREIFTDDKCLSVTIYKPKSTNLSLVEYINKIYNLNSEFPLYKTQYKISNLESITIPAMNAEEISNTYVKKGESVIWILVENNIPQGPPSCKSDYSQELENIIQSLQL